MEPRGLRGDRAWCLRDHDGKIGSGKSTRRFRRMQGLLSLRGHYEGDVPVVELADGALLRGDDPAVDDLLSRHVRRPVSLSREQAVSHFDEGPVHLVTTATLHGLEVAHGRAVDVARLRPNLVLDTGEQRGFVEDRWVGRRLAVGAEVVLSIRATMPRCVMLTLPQRGLGEDPDLLRTATRANDAQAGVVADVVASGAIRVGDAARLLD